VSDLRTRTPFSLVREVERPVEATKRELVAISRRLERQALLDPPPAVAATLQDERYLTPRTRDVYARLAAAGSRARLLARGLQAWVAPGVTGVPLDDDDPLVDEWVVVVPGREPAVLAATDLHAPDCDDDVDRCFAYAVSRDPDVVQACARALGV
jgi:DICT domain-containing protein